MKKIMLTTVMMACALLAISCTTGSATRTSSTLYQPTNSAAVQILFEKPTRPYEVIGQVGSKGGIIASDDAMYRAMQKEAAEIGAHAIWMRDSGIDHQQSWGGENYQRAKALALRWTDGGSQSVYSVTPTSVTPTTPRENQIIPQGVGE
jgi:hypothetical protein